MSEKWIFSFGVGQYYDGMYCSVEGSFFEAHQHMIDRFGTKWSMQYKEKVGLDYALMYGWKPLNMWAISDCVITGGKCSNYKTFVGSAAKGRCPECGIKVKSLRDRFYEIMDKHVGVIEEGVTREVTPQLYARRSAGNYLLMHFAQLALTFIGDHIVAIENEDGDWNGEAIDWFAWLQAIEDHVIGINNNVRKAKEFYK